MSIDLLFNSFDSLLELPTNLPHLSEAILNLAVHGELVPQDSNDRPASELLKKIRAEKAKLIKAKKIRKEKPLAPIGEDEVLYELPIGWEWARLGEATLIILGQSPPSTTYNTAAEGLPFYQGKAEFGEMHPTPTKWCSKPKKIAEKGDVLISVRAPVGPTNICNEKSCIGRGLASIRTLEGVSNLYIMYVLRAFERVISGIGSGTTFSAITGTDLNGFLIPVPPLNEQKRIVDKIENLLDKSQQIEAQLNQAEQEIVNLNESALNRLLEAGNDDELRESWQFIYDNFDLLYSDERNIAPLRQAVLQLAVKGKLVPQDPNDKPAAELLEKIKAEKQQLVKEKKIKKGMLMV